MSLFAKTPWKVTFHPPSTAAVPLLLLTQLLLWLHSNTLHIIPHQMQWRLSGVEEVCAWGIVSPCTQEILQPASLQMLNLICRRGICSSWTESTTLEDALWWLCRLACGTEHLVLLHAQMRLHSTLNRKGIHLDTDYLAPAWSHALLILTN